jgi:hypothetical protein
MDHYHAEKLKPCSTLQYLIFHAGKIEWQALHYVHSKYHIDVRCSFHHLSVEFMLHFSNHIELFINRLSTASSYNALQPIQGSGLLNHVLPTISILCHFLPIPYVHALYIFQNVIFPTCFRFTYWSLDMGFHLLIFCTLLSSVMCST